MTSAAMTDHLNRVLRPKLVGRTRAEAGVSYVESPPNPVDGEVVLSAERLRALVGEAVAAAGERSDDWHVRWECEDDPPWVGDLPPGSSPDAQRFIDFRVTAAFRRVGRPDEFYFGQSPGLPPAVYQVVR